MAEAKADPWTQVGIALLLCLAVIVLSWFTAIIERSPIHSDSWGPTLAVWGAGPVAGVVCLLTRKWSWAVAWIVGTLVGIVGFVATVLAYVITHGH